MNRESKLHGNAIYSDCENLIKVLDAEILNFNDKIDALKDFTDNDSEGNSVKAMNVKCLELSSIIEKMIEADRKDIRDLIILKNKVQDVYIDGADVLDKMEEAERGARECFDKATSLEHAADLAEFTWEADYLRGLASASRSYGESWMRLYTFWEGQAELYDEIDEETSSLFSEGREYHRQADAMIETFLQCRLTSPGFTVSKSRKISKSGRTSINGVSEEEIYKYDHDYLLRNGFSEEQIEYLYRTKPELFSSLYITAQRTSDSCPAIIQNMREELNKVVVKYRFLVDDIKKRLNLPDDEAIEILFILEKNHKLESLYGTYYHSQTDYYIILDELVNECNKWVEGNIPVLNAHNGVNGWTEEDKRRVLTLYYWSNIYISSNSIFVLEGGAAATMEKDVGIDIDLCKELLFSISLREEPQKYDDTTEFGKQTKEDDRDRNIYLEENGRVLEILKKSKYSDKAETLSYVYSRMKQLGYSDEFIIGFMANIYDEAGVPGQVEGNWGDDYWNYCSQEVKKMQYKTIDSEEDVDTLLKGIPEGTEGIGIGLCQWSGARRVSLLKFYKLRITEYNYDNLIRAEIDFMLDEMGECAYTDDKTYMDVDKNAEGMSAEECALHIWREYEKSKDPDDGPERKTIARELEKLLNNEN